jgi:nicotinamidase-related amidase
MSDPIGISDTSIALLAPLTPRIKLDRPSGVQCLKHLPRNTALLVIDMQTGFDDPGWGRRNNPDAETKVATLLAGWRAARAPIIHVHHDSPHAAGRLRPGTPGNAVKPEARPLAHEPIFRKTVNSAFIGTALEPELQALDVQALAIVGLTTNHCISTTARMAGNLGFSTFVASDATAAFDRAGLDGEMRFADDVHRAALSDLKDEFADIVDSRWLIDALR